MINVKAIQYILDIQTILTKTSLEVGSVSLSLMPIGIVMNSNKIEVLVDYIY